MTAKLTQHILLRVSHTHTIQCGNISTSVYRLPSRIWLYVTIYSVYVLGREIDDGRHREKLWLPRDRIIDNEACAERRSVTCLMCGWPKVQQDLPPVTHLYPEGSPFFFPIFRQSDDPIYLFWYSILALCITDKRASAHCVGFQMVFTNKVDIQEYTYTHIVWTV